MDELYTAIALYDEEKFTQAYELFYPLAAYKKNPEAQFYLGMMYFYGEGLTVDLEQAKDWWKKATRNGHVDAAYRLSELETSTKTTF